jgi:PAS domain S-box-containing protein
MLSLVHRPAVAYAVSLMALAAALVLRRLLDPVLGDALPLVTLFGAVAGAVWVGGYRPAVMVAVVGYAACNYLFVSPRGRLFVADAENAVGFAAYLFTCALIVVIGEAMRRAQARAGERGELMRVTLASVGDAVITTDTAGRVTSLNAVAEALTGWTQRDASGRPLDAVFHIVNEDTRQPVPNPALRALREGIAVGLANHTVLIARDGSERVIDDSAAPIRSDDGSVSGSVLIFRDISERRRMERDEANRLVAARQLASIVESSDDAIVRKSLDGTIQSWNAGAERLFGYTADQAVGRHISLVIPPDRISEEDEIIASLRAGRRVEHFETERCHSSGRRLWVSLTVSPIVDDSGRVIAASKIARDVTRQREIDAERQRFVTLVENSTDFIGICDLEGVPFYVNRAGLEMVGLDSIEAAARVHVRDFFPPEDRAKVMEELFPSALAHGHGEMDVRFRNFKTGETRWMAYKVLSLVDASGAPVALATVSQDISERRHMEDSLRQLASDLASVDRRKNEFLATLAHELRNPLAPLGNMLEVLKRTDADPRARALAVSTMERQLRQMVRLVDDLLDLNRITHNRLELRKDVVDLNAVVEQAVDASRPLADAAGHVLNVTVPPVPIRLSADAVRLGQVFGNLLNNACKYTERGGTITVRLERVDDEAVVTVEDTGAGIPADRLDGIFDMFTQVETSREKSQGGLGIGLTLVRRLADMHGGSVEARSAGAGHGSQFIVRLPIVVEARPAGGSMPVVPAAIASRRILVVDDNRDAASSLAMLLELDGHAIATAHDGPAAYEAAERQRPEVALLDLGLPVLDGYEVCRRIRQQPWGRGMLLVALTGWGQAEDRSRTRDAGFDAHLVKPVNYSDLMTLLASLGARAVSAD